MPIQYEVLEIQGDLEEFGRSIESVEMGLVKQNTLERIAEKMSEMVRQAVFESNIRSPADKISPYESGDGPPMVTSEAWQAKQTGADRWTVFPHPEVEKRAVILNYGYPGMITPTDADALRFKINGIPIYRDAVPGPEAVGYWQNAMRRVEQSDKIQEIMEEELGKELERNF